MLYSCRKATKEAGKIIAPTTINTMSSINVKPFLEYGISETLAVSRIIDACLSGDGVYHNNYIISEGHRTISSGSVGAVSI
jgi:hypothetical protein